jgi:uncharacterized protein
MKSMADKDLDIEVVFAGKDAQKVVELSVVEGTSARAAVGLSGLQFSFPEIALSECPLGRFGSRIDDNTLVVSGDRIEVYRSLMLSPKEIRRRRAS